MQQLIWLSLKQTGAPSSFRLLLSDLEHRIDAVMKSAHATYTATSKKEK
jgi:hypothetical protein